MKKLSLLSLMIFFLTACAHQTQEVADNSFHKPVHGGKLFEGEDFFVEVIGTKEKVEIYPFEYNKKSKKLEPIPADEMNVTASYSFLYHEKDEGEDSRPTSKSEASIDLTPEGDSFVGELDAENAEAYVLKINLRHKSDQESIRHEVVF